MKKNLIKKYLASAATITVLLILPVAVLAQTSQTTSGTSQGFSCDAYKQQFNLSNGNNISNNYPVYCDAASLGVKVINFLSAISGTIVIIFLIIGGFYYVTSGGNEEQSEKGRKIITNSIIGLVVIILAYTIVRIVSSLLTLGK